MTQPLSVPLSQLDQSWLHEIGATLGHVVRTVDVAKLRAASIRVIDKWRLLAGHVEWSPQLSTWCVQVPQEGDVSDRLGFTTRKLRLRLDPQFVVNGDASAQVVTRPPLNLFRAASTPSSLRSYATSKAPIISLCVTELLNCTCIGFSVPHGVLDAAGMGHFIRGLDAELHGRPWDAPFLSATNVVQEALDALEAAPPMYDDIHKETAAFSALRRTLQPVSFANILGILRNVAHEHIWHGAETRTVYFGEKTVAKLLRETRSEVERLGAGSVSMGDILAAWILKQLAKMSVAELAILHNKTLKTANDVAWVQAYNKYLKKALQGRLLPKITQGEETLIFSNQVIGRLDRVDYGSRMFGVWVWFTPLEPLNQIGINKFKGGYLIQLTSRPTRWRAVAQAVEEMDKPQPRL
ncbi:hypothetical protein H0H93_014460 [Arthromyces matolae]|nr:hypothetical protein H0H93_014460 [Arthromyces matolae]